LKKWVENRIVKEEWRNHFRKLLDGIGAGEVAETEEGEIIGRKQ